MTSDPDVLVVGAGPAGLNAAAAAATAGASVLVLDELEHPGGQYFKPTHPSHVKGRAAHKHLSDRQRLLDEIRRLDVDVKVGATVWGVFEDRFTVATAGRSLSVKPRAVVLATGAYDRPVPFPGWTLPGVLSAGAVQTFAKSHAVTPGSRILVAGAGPFLLPVTTQLIELGTPPIALLEATGVRDWLGRAPAAWGQWHRFAEGLGYWRSLRRAPTDVRLRQKVLSVAGDDRVREATICRVGDDWRSIPGTEETLTVDLVAVGYGFVPSVEIPDLMGCELAWNDAGGYWYVVHDENMETTRPGVFVAGEIAGVGGADQAIVEGRLAGIRAAGHAGLTEDAASAGPLRQKRRRLKRFAEALDDVFGPRPGLWEGLTGETVVCRCEEVTAGSIRARISSGCTTPKQIKDWTRAQMGLCQGRMCGPAVAELVSQGTGTDRAAIPRASVRPPVKPVAISALAEMDEETES